MNAEALGLVRGTIPPSGVFLLRIGRFDSHLQMTGVRRLRRDIHDRRREENDEEGGGDKASDQENVCFKELYHYSSFGLMNGRTEQI